MIQELELLLIAAGIDCRSDARSSGWASFCSTVHEAFLLVLECQ